MSPIAGLVIETTVALLLAVTIGYSIALERRLRAMRLNEGELRATIAELAAASDRAERAVGVLRQAVEDSDAELTRALAAAGQRGADLAAAIEAGDAVVARLGRIVQAVGMRAAA